MQSENLINDKFRRNFPADKIVENKEDVTLIWLDENIDNSIEILNKLRQLNDFILLYTNSQLCLDYIRQVRNEKIILILSKYFYKTKFLNDIHSLEIIDSIFIYSNDKNIDRNFYPKKVDFFNEENALLKSIECRRSLISKQITFGFSDNYLKWIRDLKSKPASFLWFHILIDILKELPKTNEAKQQMIKECQDYYQNNNITQPDWIKDFEDHYQSSDAIRWYTKSIFLYKIINKSLRTEDVYLLYRFRYYIIDLCQQLKDESYKYFSSLSENQKQIKLYRGQTISEKELEMYKNSIGNFISPNGFFSTSEDREIALEFAGDDQVNGVLFEITINSLILKQPSMLTVAPIQHLSYVQDEREFLFGIGTIFKIENVVYDYQINKQCIQITPIDKDFQYIQEYIQLKRKELDETNPITLFGELMIDIGEYSKAELYFKETIETYPDLPSLYHGLGYVYYKKGLYNEALKYGHIAHDMLKTTRTPYHIEIVQSFINLGWDYKKNGDFRLAVEHFEEALRRSQTLFLNQDHYITAMAHTSIGDTLTSLGDYQYALDCLEKGLDMFKRILPSEHTEIANTLMKFGYFYEKQSLIDRAIEYYHLGYEMATKTMTSDHPRLLEYFQDILHIYNKTNNIDQFIQFSNKNLEFQRQSLGDIHPNIAKIYIIIGDLMKNNEQKLFHYKQALDILEKCLPINQEAILNCQNKIIDATTPPNN